MKELFIVDADHIEEDMVLHDALYALRALRSCVVHEAKNGVDHIYGFD